MAAGAGLNTLETVRAFEAEAMRAVTELEGQLYEAKTRLIYARRRRRQLELAALAELHGPAAPLTNSEKEEGLGSGTDGDGGVMEGSQVAPAVAASQVAVGALKLRLPPFFVWCVTSRTIPCH